ncbi:hypothetical protein [Burkholderia plantarii]|uniref:hypothetical protein n=1 Tax=Burkholderia plantarii TaxID=41899 RepID=UPI00114D0A0B|nr:hypothetical protein [Burkholderia plantarii]
MCIRDRARTLPLPVASITPPVSVSYTHLDVYKRQGPHAAVTGRVDHATGVCLLYTSRCV